MKKILITMPSMFIGGAERSLLGLLESFDYEKYQVNLMLYRHEGEFMNLIPKEVNILDEVEEYTTFDRPIKELLFSKLYMFGIARLKAKLRLKKYCILANEKNSVWKSLQFIYDAITPLLPNIQGEYDLAISFLGMGNVIADKVNARKKIAWVHTDYSILEPNREMDLDIFDKLDYVVTVSNKCQDEFLKVYPEQKDKSIVIENILTSNFIKKQCEIVESISDMKREKDEIIFLSIGRFCDAKNFENIPYICKNLIDMNFNIKWYIIGYGSDEVLIKENIKAANVEDRVIILGKKINPYPYIKNCDFYIQPSRYEGKAVTVREAQMLEKICIITDFATAKSQLSNGIDGVIVPMDNTKCAIGIAKLLKNKGLQNQIKNNLSIFNYENKLEINKIYDLVK